ncbi:hypothetical protein [Actinoplanes sp. NPDC026619]|uniref:effector-associated constant component EACC1 n=1 Tax=Actinoplanes sp. NPDC026619 TaxID=3155798 RepID=UPI0033C1671A
MQTINIIIEPNSGRELEHLAGWLIRNPAIRMHGNVRTVIAPPPPERMAVGVADCIELALTSGLSAAQLVVAIISWRRSRPPERRLSITVTRGETTIVIDTDDPALAGDLAHQLGSYQ